MDRKPIITGISTIDKSKRAWWPAAVKFPTLDQALQQVLDKMAQTYGPTVARKQVSKKSGSSNIVVRLRATFANGTVKNIAVRWGERVAFEKIDRERLIGEHTSFISQAATPAEDAELKAEAAQSEDNWRQAHRLGLSPELYFYGYIVSAQDSLNLYLCAISEGFDKDVETFYSPNNTWASLNPDEQARVDNEIRRQFTDLFNNMAKEMKMICFDIKPANAVINYTSPNNLTVKLIDWDADYCKKHIRLRQWSIEYAGILMQMIMAMFFYGYFHNNIFSEHLKQTLRSGSIKRRNRLRRSLKTLFCSQELSHFANTAQWYFIQNGPHNIIPAPAPGYTANTADPHSGIAMDPSICGKLFDSIYNRVIFKNKLAYLQGTPENIPRWRRAARRDSIIRWSEFPTQRPQSARGTPARSNIKQSPSIAVAARAPPLTVMRPPTGGNKRKRRKRYKTRGKKGKRRRRTRRRRRRRTRRKKR